MKASGHGFPTVRTEAWINAHVAAPPCAPLSGWHPLAPPLPCAWQGPRSFSNGAKTWGCQRGDELWSQFEFGRKKRENVCRSNSHGARRSGHEVDATLHCCTRARTSWCWTGLYTVYRARIGHQNVPERTQMLLGLHHSMPYTGNEPCLHAQACLSSRL